MDFVCYVSFDVTVVWEKPAAMNDLKLLPSEQLHYLVFAVVADNL